jgi:hypothetical protein
MRVFLLFILLFTACEKPLRPPYIPPALQHWPQSYKGVAGVKLHVFKTGEVTVPKKLAYRGGSLLETLVLDVLAFAIEHPRKGVILVGTGLSRGIVDEADGYLGVFRTAIGSPTMAEGQDILSQLESAGLSAERVRNIILPDLRFSHTGELENFPHAQVIVSSVEYTTAKEEGESALSLSDEYDGVRQWQFIDFVGAEPLGAFRAHRDLFNDGSVLLIDVAGATPGGLAVLVRLPHAPVLLCGNLAWTAEQARYVREPGFVFNRQSWWENAWKLKKFTELAPELVILPDHEWDAVEAAKTRDMIIHSFPPVREVKSSPKKGEEHKSRKKKKNRVKKKQEVQAQKRSG